jgi:hypothetical protein
MWRPARPATLVVGRARVPFSKLRQYDEADLPGGGVPFAIDRIAPDRRWGAALLGDLGSGSYALGVYEDLDRLEPRRRVGDLSAGGSLAALGHLEWTPRAPMSGSNPPGKVPGARGPLPTPRADPWFGTLRWSLGLGALYRLRDDDSSRVDVSFSVQCKYRWFAALGEVIVSRDGADTALAAWAQLMTTPSDKVSLTAHGEWDGGAGEGGEWAASGGIAWHATRDRRSKIALVLWLRRDVATGLPRDGAVVLLQAVL